MVGPLVPLAGRGSASGLGLGAAPLQAAASDVGGPSPAAPPLPTRQRDGVSLAFLLDFASRVPAGYTTADVANRIVRPFTAAGKCSYLDLLQPGLSAATAEGGFPGGLDGGGAAAAEAHSLQVPGQAPQRGPLQYVVAHSWELDFGQQLLPALQRHVQLQDQGEAAPTPSAVELAQAQAQGEPKPQGAAQADGDDAAAAAGTVALGGEGVLPPPPPPATPVYLWLDLFCLNLHACGDGSGAGGCASPAAGQQQQQQQVAAAGGGGGALAGPPAATLATLREVVMAAVPLGARAAEAPCSPALPGAVAPAPEVALSSPTGGPASPLPTVSPSTSPIKAPASASPAPLLLVLDAQCTALSSPHCLYALWLRARANKQRVLRARVHSAGRLKPASRTSGRDRNPSSARYAAASAAGTASSRSSLSYEQAQPQPLLPAEAGAGIVPLCLPGQDLLLCQLAWEQMAGALVAPPAATAAAAAPDSASGGSSDVDAHAAISGEVTSAMEGDAAEEEAAGVALQVGGSVRRSTNSFTSGTNHALGAGPPAGLGAFPPHHQPVSPLEAAAALVQSAVLGALQTASAALAAEAEPETAALGLPPGGVALPLPRPPRTLGLMSTLADVADTAGCLLWAAGRLADAEAQLSRCVLLWLVSARACVRVRARGSRHSIACLCAARYSRQ